MMEIGSFFRHVEGLIDLLEQSPGFSLKLDGNLCPGDGFSGKRDGASFIYTDGKARVAAEYRFDERHNALMYALTVKNTSSEKLRVSDVHSIDFHLLTEQRDVRVHTFDGGYMENFYPPRALSHSEMIMSPGQRYPDPMTTAGYRIASGSGRSSDSKIALCMLENKQRTGGVFFGIYWSGDWYLDTAKLVDGRFRVYGGMQFLDMELEPGEELELPSVVLAAYEGDTCEGFNSIRRFVLGLHPRRTETENLPPISYDHWFGLGVNISEEVMKRQCDRLDGLGIEYFVMDAGWFSNDTEGTQNFMYGTGNFTLPDKKKFPDGMVPLYRYVKEKGYRGGLWFEPEHAGEGTDIQRKIPDALLDFPDSEDHKLMLVDFGNPAVLAYTKAYLKKHITELDLRWIRWDCNIDPRPYWKANDKPGRRGESELKHIKGLYEVLAWINREFPQVFLESCASGGYRIDLGIMRYSDSFWASDQTFEMHPQRAHLMTGNLFMPGICLNRGLTPRLPEGEDIPDYFFMSLFGGSFGINDPIQLWSETTRERCRRHLEVYKRLRVYLNKDYYLLLPPAASLEDNEGWEFIDREKAEGFFQLFRSEGKASRVTAKLRGLKRGAEYILTDPYTDEVCTVSGAALEDGIAFELDNFSSVVRLFREK